MDIKKMYFVADTQQVSNDTEVEEFRAKKKKAEQNIDSSIFEKGADGRYNKSDECEEMSIYDISSDKSYADGSYFYYDSDGDGKYDEAKIYDVNSGKIFGSYEDTDADGNYDIYKAMNEDGSIGVYDYNPDKNEFNFKENKNFKLDSDGKIGDFKQGQVGDCNVLAAIESISNSKNGQKAIKNAIKDNKDGSYTIHFEGSGGKDYKITEKEIVEAVAHNKYSSGDIDVILLEMGYEKYCKENDNIVDRAISGVLGIKGADKKIEGKDLSHFVEALLGKESEKSYFDKTDTLKEFEKVQDRAAATVGFFGGTHLTDVNGNDVDMTGADNILGGGHAWSIKTVDKDTVTLVNPHDTSKEYTFSREDFLNNIMNIEYVDLEK